MWLIRQCNFLVLFCLLSKPISFHASDIDYRLCGRLQSCKGNRTANELKAYPCCALCGCSEECKEKDTCCHDKEGRNETKNVIKQECIPGLHFPEVLSQEILHIQSYYVRTKCPVGTKDDYIKARCETGKPKTLQELVYVSSGDGTLVYKNKFCALCHGENDTITWQIYAIYQHLQCSNLVNFVSEGNVNVTSATDYIIENCVLVFGRPDKVDPRNVVCFDEHIVTNKCNKTGKWDTYNKELVKLCENPPAPVYSYGQVKIYKNIYCHMCNLNSSYSFESCHDIFERFPHKGTFEIINLLRWGKQELSEDKVCRTDQIYDAVFGQCKALHCPTISLPINGKCLPFLEFGYSYLMLVKLVPVEMMNSSGTVIRELSESFPTIKRKLGFGACELCNGILFTDDTLENVQGGLSLQFYLRQAKECPTENIWSKLIKMEQCKQTITMTVDKRKIQFQVYWDYNIEEAFKKAYDVGKASMRMRCRTMYPKHGSYCPNIQLTEMEYKTVLKDHSNANELLIIPNVDDTNGTNGTVFVCIDGYLSKDRSGVIQTHALVSLIIVVVHLRLVV